jgi:hypothetical protein
MIYHVFHHFSKPVKGFWRFWTLGGLLFMTSAVLDSQDLFVGFLDKSDEEVVNLSHKFSWLVWFRPLKFVDNSSLKKVSFAEVLNHALPLSLKIVEFNNLIENIRVTRKTNQSASFTKRDDSKIFEAIALLSDIVDIHWNEFSLESKVLLLGKLQKFNKSKESFITEMILRSLIVLPWKLCNYSRYMLEFIFSNKQVKQDISIKADSDFSLILNSLSKLLQTTQRIFEKDGKLLEQNRGNISNFTSELRHKIWEDEILEEVDRTTEIIRNGKFKRLSLDDFKASLFSDDE